LVLSAYGAGSTRVEYPGVHFTGRSGEMAVGAYAFISMLEHLPDETVTLLIFQGRPKRGGRRMVQVVSADGGRGLTPQVDV
jgi:hypothetical protein